MTTLSLDDAQQMLGTTLLDPDGAKLGKVADVYMDSDTQTPEWALVHTGMFGGRESFVPLAQAHKAGSGVQVPYSKEQVRGGVSASEGAAQLTGRGQHVETAKAALELSA